MVRAVSLLIGFGLLSAADSKSGAFDRAMLLWKEGQHTNAISAATEGLKANSTEDRLLNLRAQMNSILGNYAAAVTDLTAAIALQPESGFLFRERALARFKLAQFRESAADFDRVNVLIPKIAAENWQRGIALYYAGRFADGRQQFELHKTVNPEDVENAVWHFLCTAREQSVEVARKKLMPIKGDSRVPMKEIHSLFAGLIKPGDVLAAAKAGSPSPAELRYQTFYAHLYLGLYFQALGDDARCREEILAAVPLADPVDFMGTVAKVHSLRFKDRSESSPK